MTYTAPDNQSRVLWIFKISFSTIIRRITHHLLFYTTLLILQLCSPSVCYLSLTRVIPALSVCLQGACLSGSWSIISNGDLLFSVIPLLSSFLLCGPLSGSPRLLPETRSISILPSTVLLPFLFNQIALNWG